MLLKIMGNGRKPLPQGAQARLLEHLRLHVLQRLPALPADPGWLLLLRLMRLRSVMSAMMQANWLGAGRKASPQNASAGRRRSSRKTPVRP